MAMIEAFCDLNFHPSDFHFFGMKEIEKWKAV